ncbi:unnamed protein product [Vitrella brassicaformis CCMP3155]|uniref:protein-L-isoaspartate(D-aspartate) O-methyltransferase n=1 Tax=Vitrella brassicaformis (strain CCMP3155) TaxID=1169540 RepID=A0A0G4FS87_VITBC|nr:unnamed protein product [Vitrella brassicaformis CCMP3155]|mmetsp:Transcript_25955/g.64501  ORF Transcript_25955/g.64501 Transcript_25955/m.64501 type:complete len:264 (-) Transcript_25955:113-904(-)|eukprot:CEM17523.1 unnamed protein product [Vitrella brassicaformis CCMP3155]
MAWRCHGNTHRELIDNLQRAGLLRTPRVIEAMKKIDRGHFTVEGPTSAMSYRDSPQPIGYNATISAPHMHCEMIELLEGHLKDGAVALDVGSGSGYLTAVMADLCSPTGRTYGVEHIPELVEMSQANAEKSCPRLLASGCLKFVVADGQMGLPDAECRSLKQEGKEMPLFDAIHVGAAAAAIPDSLLHQLKPGGVMVIPVGPKGGDQTLMKLTKDAAGRVHRENITSVIFVPLTSKEAQLADDNSTKVNLLSLMLSSLRGQGE